MSRLVNKTRTLWLVAAAISFLALTFVAGLNLGQRFTYKGQFSNGQNSSEAQIELGKLSEPKPNKLPGSILHGASERALGENRIADVAFLAAPCVVNIESITKAAPILKPDIQSFRLSPFSNPRPFADTGHVPRPLATGSGLIVRSDGYVVTNNHLIRAGCDLKVTLNDQRSFKAKLIGRDIFTDLAVVKIEADHLPVMPFGNSKEIRPGEWAIAIGNALGFDHTVTLGIVSAINRSLGDMNTHVELIQTDAAINPGNSGGPLLNVAGEVIGITSAIRSDAQNIGFAIPVDVVEQVAKGLIKKGVIVRPYLGVYMKDLDARVISGLNLPADSHGVLILKVVTGSPAQRAGITAGDLIEKCEGTPVSSATDVRHIVKKFKPGDFMSFSIFRDGRSDTKKLLIGNYPNEE